MIYDLDGNSLSSAYDIDGISLNNAYDIDGTEIWSSTNELKVMSFNVGSWYGYAKYVPTAQSQTYYDFFNTLFVNNDCDLLGIQEYYSLIGNLSAPNLLNSRFGNIYAINRQSNPTKAGRCLASKYSLSNTAEINFTNQSGEVRSFLTSTFNFNGKTIYFITTHLALTSAEIILQIGELLNYVADKEYWIMTGDFNIRFDSAESSGYTELIERFKNQGYNVANGDAFGFIPTWCASDSTTDWHCIDNIMTSGNISITNLYTDTSKVTAYENGYFEYGIDHIPLIAELELT